MEFGGKKGEETAAGFPEKTDAKVLCNDDAIQPPRPPPPRLTPAGPPGDYQRMMWDGVFNLTRWLAGIGLLGLAYHWGVKMQDPIDPVALLIGIFCFFAGVVMMWKPIFFVVTRPFMAFIDAIFFPGGPIEKPVLNLKLPAHYLDEARYEEALAEYRQILKHYPDEAEAYEKAIWLEAAVFKDAAAAKSLLKRAKRRHLVLDPAIVSLAETRNPE